MQNTNTQPAQLSTQGHALTAVNARTAGAALVLAALALSSLPASAGNGVISRRTAYTVAGAIHAADFIGTELCLGRGCSEGNTWAPVDMQKRGWRAATQVVGTVGTAEAVHYASKHSPLAARITLGAVVAMKGAAVGSAVSYRISWQRRRALLK
jgi:hypothetical protein